MFKVYVLYSKSLDKYYKGSTSDISDRIRRHNAGQEKATKAGCPWELVASFPKPDRSAATILERKLKNLSRIRLVEFIEKHHAVVGNDELP